MPASSNYASNFESTDTGAPVLTGQAGALITVLDALLINGYNSKTGLAITRSGTTATVTLTAHGARTGQVLLIAGANEADYNGLAKVTVISANQYTYQVTGSPATPATGTITSKVAGAGWTKPFSGTNLAGYLAPGGGCYYRVDDTGTTSARIVGYKNMTDINTGTDPFPTNAQVASGLYIPKSNTADATARPWSVIAQRGGKLIFGRVQRTSVVAASSLFNFGEIPSRKTGDIYNWINRCSTSATSASDPNDNTLGVASAAVQAGFYCCRSYTQTGAAIQMYQAGEGVIANGIFGAAGYAFPDLVAGEALLYNPRQMEASTLPPRGFGGGAYMPCHIKPVSDSFITNGTGVYAGRDFVAWNFGVSSTGQIWIELTTVA